MNKIYRLKFSKRLNQLVAVSEITVGHDRNSGSNNDTEIGSTSTIAKFLKLKPLAGIISILSFGFATQTAMANGLQGMEVVNGTASMSVNGKNTTITNTPDAIINWKQFNINQDELVRFVQENSNSAVFNRVTSDQISQLKGALNSNGHVFLINPNGIVMGKDAVINTAGFTASTLNISDKDLKARNFNFEQAKDKAMAQIVNNGLISVSKNGSVNLIGGSVKNNGVIKVEDGNILLLAGQKVTISDITNPTITYSVVAPKNEAVNLGTIFAKNGKIQMHAGSVVNKGTLNANSVRKDKSGTIILSAKEGEANIDGTVTLNNANFKAGSLTITGKKVVLNSGAKVELTGKQGGTVYIGGDERGQGKIQLAEKTEIKQGASINVSGSEKGGKAIVWGDRAQVDGKITAKGKDKKNSGFVETSGKYLGVGKTAKVEAKDWLLDPYNVRIVSDPETQSPGVSKQPAITISGTEKDVKILNTTIQDALNEGTDVTITTAESADATPVGGQGNFTVEADIVKSGAAAEANLTMIANHTFTQNQGTSIKATAGKLNLNVTADKNLVLNGNIDTNEGSLAMATNGNVTIDGATIKGDGAITQAGKSGNTLTVNNVNLTGYGAGLNLNVTPATSGDYIMDLNATWEGNLNVTGNVSFNRIDDSGKNEMIRSEHLWNTNLTVNSGSNFNFTDTTRRSSRIGNAQYLMKIGKDVVFNTAEGTNATFNLKPYLTASSGAGIRALIVEGNLTSNGAGTVSFSTESPAFAAGGIVLNSTYINTTGSSVLNLTGTATSRSPLTINNDITINAGDTSSVNLRAVNNSGLTVNKNLTPSGTGSVAL